AAPGCARAAGGEGPRRLARQREAREEARAETLARRRRASAEELVLPALVEQERDLLDQLAVRDPVRARGHPGDLDGGAGGDLTVQLARDLGRDAIELACRRGEERRPVGADEPEPLHLDERDTAPRCRQPAVRLPDRPARRRREPEAVARHRLPSAAAAATGERERRGE